MLVHCKCISDSWLNSRTDTCENCAKCGKDFKIVTNEAYSRVRASLKIFCFCWYASMAASDKGISLKRKILEKGFG